MGFIPEEDGLDLLIDNLQELEFNKEKFVIENGLPILK